MSFSNQVRSSFTDALRTAKDQPQADSSIDHFVTSLMDCGELLFGSQHPNPSAQFAESVTRVTEQRALLLLAHAQASESNLPERLAGRASFAVARAGVCYGSLEVRYTAAEISELPTPVIERLVRTCAFWLHLFERETMLSRLQLPTADQVQSVERLADREREVLLLLMQGYTSADMSHMMTITRRTVDSHRAHLFEKLGVSNQHQAIHIAQMAGLTPALSPKHPISPVKGKRTKPIISLG